jgi:hypothetical protein
MPREQSTTQLVASATFSPTLWSDGGPSGVGIEDYHSALFKTSGQFGELSTAGTVCHSTNQDGTQVTVVVFADSGQITNFILLQK